MASVSKRVRDGQTTYVVRWRDDADKQHKKSFSRKWEADKFRAHIEHSLNSGTYISPTVSRQTFQEVAEAWCAAQPHRPTTEARMRSQFTRHVYPVLGPRAIGAIKRSEVQAFVTSLGTQRGELQPLAATTARMVFAGVRAVFRAAMMDRIIALDPSVKVALPEPERQQILPLTTEQVALAIERAPAPYGTLILAGAGLGLRQAELFGLRVGDIDFLRGTLKVQRQVLPAPGGGLRAAPLKTKSAYRTLPVSNTVRDALALHLRDHPGREYVFTGPDGLPLRREWVNNHVWRPARKALGLGEGEGMHTLRHFYASALIRAGLSVKAVSTLLGHANAAVTLNVYAHLWPDDDARTRQAVDEFLRPAPRERPGEAA